MYFFSGKKREGNIVLRYMLQREVSRYIYAQRRIQRWVMVVLGGGLQPPYHPRSHGNPFKFSIEILRRRKEKEEEGERKKKRKESPPNTQSYPYDFRQQLSALFLE
jgi:hypothetical protein